MPGLPKQNLGAHCFFREADSYGARKLKFLKSEIGQISGERLHLTAKNVLMGLRKLKIKQSRGGVPNTT